MQYRMFFPSLFFFLTISATVFPACGLVGKVIDTSGAGISNAVISVTRANMTATSDSNGAWTINVPSSTQPFLRRTVLPLPLFNGKTLYFVVGNESEPVTVSVYTLNGRWIYNALDRQLPSGFYRIEPLHSTLAAATYALKVRIGTETRYFRTSSCMSTGKAAATPSLSATIHPDAPRLEKKKVVIDTVTVSKPGFTSAIRVIGSYDDTVNVTLVPLIPAYHLNPPNPCYNQFYAKDCIPGDSSSACGGHCTVANSCSPPEDASKSNLPKTFICPRFMLFSTEMLQAARDDANIYGWEDPDDPPFNYGVVGHDPDVGGVDDVQSSCCQCYQIIFKTPEPSSPQPPELPYPKPLIVQSFNTAASGPKGFDVFMGAGGYGAFNACYNDPAFGNTTNFDEFIYDGYPYQNPGMGGISFLRCEECIQGWPPTLAGVQSDACQKKIEQLCNQARVDASPQITEDTRRSCIETNKVESLYHQNWEVMVKRVRCPENLTRVTGCRLKEDKLPLPLPEVKTPADAESNGTFRDGYHTTTMQDCCKPTCAWADWVVNYNLPADGEWNSFYSCDKNGVPLTKE